MRDLLIVGNVLSVEVLRLKTGRIYLFILQVKNFSYSSNLAAPVKEEYLRP